MARRPRDPLMEEAKRRAGTTKAADVLAARDEIRRERDAAAKPKPKPKAAPSKARPRKRRRRAPAPVRQALAPARSATRTVGRALVLMLVLVLLYRLLTAAENPRTAAVVTAVTRGPGRVLGWLRDPAASVPYAS